MTKIHECISYIQFLLNTPLIKKKLKKSKFKKIMCKQKNKFKWKYVLV